MLPYTTHFLSLQEILICFTERSFSEQIQQYVVDVKFMTVEFQRLFKDFAIIETEIICFSLPFSVDPD